MKRNEQREALLREARKEAVRLEGELVALGISNETLGELLVMMMHSGDMAAINIVSRLCDGIKQAPGITCVNRQT